MGMVFAEVLVLAQIGPSGEVRAACGTKVRLMIRAVRRACRDINLSESI